ncbi:hypothetical protein A5699_27845 [Mycobacterium sp. E802]|nr:hypothetical protein A5699_27845 [Mycobacterium sp. E802]
MSAVPSGDVDAVSRSKIDGWSTADLSAASPAWRQAATKSEEAFEQHRQNIVSPGGTTWEGDAKDAAMDRATVDAAVVRRHGDMLREAADIAENGIADINAAKREALVAITAAEAAGFTVHENLSVTDACRYDITTIIERNKAATEHAADIHWYAERLVQTDTFVGQRLQQKALELEGIRFSAEEHVGDSTVQLVNHPFKETPLEVPFPLEPAPFGGSIEVSDDAINSESPVFPPNLKARDEQFATSDKNAAQRFLEGTDARAEGEAAVLYLRARGWHTAADVITHYLGNESGGRDPSMAKPFRLSTAQADALADDASSGYQGNKSLPTILENARQTAIANAAQSNQPVYTEVLGSDPMSQQMGRGWNPVGTSDPDNVYAFGRYSVQVVTQVEAAPGQEPVVRQRYFVYDYTDYAHPQGSGGGPIESIKRSAIDGLATLRDIGWARGFDTTGTSSIRTYP